MRTEAFAHMPDWAGLGAAARDAERAGFGAVATPEITGDPFISAAILAQASTKPQIRTAIAVAFARSPMVVAASAWQLHENSGGRFCLGLGTQIKAHNERRFSVPWTPPYPRLRDYVGAIRAIHHAWQTGERLAFESEHYTHTLMTPEFAPPPSEHGPIPIYTAAVRPAMLRLAGRVADGVRLHGFCTRRYLQDVVLPNLRAGMERTDRKREHFEICGGGFIATGRTAEDVARQVEWVRYRLAFYGSTPAYWPVLEAHGWQDLGLELNALSKQGRWPDMAARIDDDMLREFTAVATWDDLAAEVQRRFGGLSDSIELNPPGPEQAEALSEVLADINALPCGFVGPQKR